MATKTSTTRKTTRTTPRSPRKRTWGQRLGSGLRNVGRFLMGRARDIALILIVAGAFVAVFDGSLYSATKFGFHAWSAPAFAVMPDALMVICAAKQRQVGVSPAQWAVAHRWMQFAFRFSLVTNMIAAAMRQAPAEWVHTRYWALGLFVGGVIYHGIVVWFLKGAVDVLTTVRADRKAKGANVSEPAMAPIPVNTATVAWADTILASAKALVRPMSRNA